jgi:hypothetical protein
MTQEGGLMLPGNSATHLAPITTPILPADRHRGHGVRLPRRVGRGTATGRRQLVRISGTNVHVVLEGTQSRAGSTPANPERAMLLPLSARSPQAL